MRIWAWGANSNGQLGLNYKSEQESLPTEVKFSLPEREYFSWNPMKITGGASHTVLLVRSQRDILSDVEDGTAVAVQLELEKRDDPGFQHEQIQVSPNFQILTYSQEDSLHVSSGWDFTLLLRDFEPLLIHSFGNNSYGQLARTISEEEVHLSGKKNNSITWGSASYGNDGVDSENYLNSVSAGMRHALATGFIDHEEVLFVWGDNSKHQLGLQLQGAPGAGLVYPKVVDKPTVVPDLFGVRLIACGKDFSVAVGANGEILGCGQNKFGVLLHAPQDIKEFKTWTEIYTGFPPLAHDRNDWICDIKCGWTHVIVLFESGVVMSWGRNNFGQLGRQSINPEFDVEPGEINFPESIEAIACGTEHNLALGVSGKVYAFGWNEHDNCGVKVNSSEEQLTNDVGACASNSKDWILLPTEVHFPEEVGRIQVIGCGAGSSFAISES